MADAPRFPLMAREHPKFDQASLPADIPAGFEDSTWCNDTCPSMLNEAAGLILFFDYPEAADREFPETPRFSLGVWDNGATGENVVASDDWADIQIALGARLFADNLRADLGAENFAQMRIDNVGNPGDDVCASHDYCDANMNMLQAFDGVFGRESDLEGSDLEFMGKAWSLAKRLYLRATPEEALTKEFADWTEENGFPEGDATELLMGAELTGYQRAWLENFSGRWQALQDTDQSTAGEPAAPLLPWAVTVWPDFYTDPLDVGYAWSGQAADEADAIRRALVECWADSDRDDEPPTYDPAAAMQDGFKVVSTDVDFRELSAAVIRVRRAECADPGVRMAQIVEALDRLDAGFRASGRDV